jgi:tetrahydromethanopterin S-methyltransferase subunit A
MLTTTMNNRLDSVIETHGLGGDGSGKKTDAEKMSANLRKAVDKDIGAIRDKAMFLADERKAGLEKEAADAAQALFDATKERATNAGAQKAKLQSQLQFYQG